LALGQTAPAQIVNEAFIRLNWILNLWNAKRWMTWQLVDLFVHSAGQLYFNVGPGGDFAATFGDFNLPDFNTPDFNAHSNNNGSSLRPLKIEKAYARMTNSPGIPTDYQLKLIPSYEDYTKIILKTMTNFPTHFFYDPSLPTGRVFFWPIPQSGLYEMHILVRQALDAFATLDTNILLPPEYIPALELTLAVWLRRAAKMPPDPELAMLAKDAVNTIRVNNTELEAMDMPAALTRPSIYNILADEWH
jgi:hypothetical protein